MIRMVLFAGAMIAVTQLPILGQVKNASPRRTTLEDAKFLASAKKWTANDVPATRNGKMVKTSLILSLKAPANGSGWELSLSVPPSGTNSPCELLDVKGKRVIRTASNIVLEYSIEENQLVLKNGKLSVGDFSIDLGKGITLTGDGIAPARTLLEDAKLLASVEDWRTEKATATVNGKKTQTDLFVKFKADANKASGDLGFGASGSGTVGKFELIEDKGKRFIKTGTSTIEYTLIQDTLTLKKNKVTVGSHILDFGEGTVLNPKGWKPQPSTQTKNPDNKLPVKRTLLEDAKFLESMQSWDAENVAATQGGQATKIPFTVVFNQFNGKANGTVSFSVPGAGAVGQAGLIEVNGKRYIKSGVMVTEYTLDSETLTLKKAKVTAGKYTINFGDGLTLKAVPK